MVTTPNGTSYTQTDFTSSYGEPARRCVPAAATRKLLIFCHGNPGSDTTSADTQFTGNSNYATVRNWLIDNGWAFVEGRGAGAGWGNQASRDAYRAMYNDLSGVLGGITEVVVVGRSMGGLVGAYLASLDPVISPKCSGFVCLSGTLDLAVKYAGANTTDKAALHAAYGVSDQAGFATASVGHDPMQFPLGTWSGMEVSNQYASGDTTVPPADHAQPWGAKYGPEMERHVTWVTSGGDHNSSAGTDPEQATATVNFLSTLTVPSARAVAVVKARLGGAVRDVAAVFVMQGGVRKAVAVDQMRAGA